MDEVPGGEGLSKQEDAVKQSRRRKNKAKKKDGQEEEEALKKRESAAGRIKQEVKRGKTQRSTTEEMEREAKGDLNHNPLLNFTRSRFTQRSKRCSPLPSATSHL